MIMAAVGHGAVVTLQRLLLVVRAFVTALRDFITKEKREASHHDGAAPPADRRTTPAARDAAAPDRRRRVRTMSASWAAAAVVLLHRRRAHTHVKHRSAIVLSNLIVTRYDTLPWALKNEEEEDSSWSGWQA